MTRDEILELCKRTASTNNVLEEIEAVFRLPIPRRLNLFDYSQTEKLCTRYETSYARSIQVHMLVRALEAVPSTISFVDFLSTGEGSLPSGGVYLKPGDTIEVRVTAPWNVRKVSVRLLGLEFSPNLLR